ncbi:TyrS [Desulforapulum autotrophicum HRM2]|uniref:Tyrosine--tRNA ligase n=2 Tax=Desulforapulum autotrophicum TaxID=2296 RepID=C0Q973_DESAH|nr:TyrS [Desulforapulum autotrophicum HRM2]
MNKMSVLDILNQRGFVEAVTHEDELKEYLDKEGATCYIGFDPTGPSLHVGHLVTIMALAHMQRNGHRPIALVGGGTGLIGDPSGKTEMRKVITHDQVNENKQSIQKQLSRFLDFEDGKAMLLDNADWLTGLEYISFLRDIGRHFSVNKMIKAESYRVRIESDEGLSFIEFNYMLLQAYDFMQLCQAHDCRLQMGGSDQWGNIVAGIDLVRRTQSKTAFGITFPLITTSSGIKMGKTHKGAVWLDPEKTSSYEYYQFWVNTDDADVAKFMALFTFLPMAEIDQVKGIEGAKMNAAKAILAHEATAIAHGLAAANEAFDAAATVFGAPSIPENLCPSSHIPRDGDGNLRAASSMPSSTVDIERLKRGIAAVDLFVETGLSKSKGDARRLISQGGGYLNNDRIEAFDTLILDSDFKDGEILLRAGKKRYHKIIA